MAREQSHRPTLRLVPPSRDDGPLPAATGTDVALCEAIDSWLRSELSGDELFVGRMMSMAMSLRADGASIDETCARVRGLARCWLRHPANNPSHGHLRLVSVS